MPPVETIEADTPIYEAYAQLTKMLLPSSGCLAIYAADGDLLWCSGGFERPDFRQLVDEFRLRNEQLESNHGVVRETAGGVIALLAWLADARGDLLGYVLIELGQALSSAGKSMAASMTRPLIRCLASQIALELTHTIPPPRPAPVDPKLRFLLSLGDIDLNAPSAIRELLQRCVDQLNCLSAVFCIPDQDLTETAYCADRQVRAQLEATRKHLLAWVQLNNRPMVVNRIDALKAPYKILSCPVVDRDSNPMGLIALFRGPDSKNFELDDVRLIELLGRQTMALLTERRDPESGLMSRPAFERYLEAHHGDRARAPEGMLLFIDINDLKSINESFGFAVGDEAILRVAKLIRRSLGAQYCGCRLAADRFIVYLPTHDRPGAERLGSELVAAARSLGYRTERGSVPLSLRFGVTAPPAGGKARHWIAEAELACQRGRQNPSASPYNGTGVNAGDPNQLYSES